MTAVRDLRDDESHAIGELLSRAGFGPTVSGLVTFPRDSPAGDVLVAERGGRAVGGVCCASFGTTGWIGALGVLPDARRRGVGEALAEAACERLRERGAETILLFATDMGRPLYDRLGFVAEGGATAWRGVAGVPHTRARLRVLREDDRPAMRDLDHIATAERRDPMLDALDPLTGLVAEQDGRVSGWAVTSPWGSGVAICAADTDSGRALLAAAAGGRGQATMVVPNANETAAEALRRWRFQPTNAGARMRLGPPLDWRPDMQYGLFNLFWG